VNGIIYKAINLLNNKIYIGKTEKSLEKRKRSHKTSSYTKGIDGAIKKYGFVFFYWEVIDECKIEKLNERESYYIKKLKSHVSEGGYNLTFGGEGVSGWKHDNITKKKISKRTKELWKDLEYRKKIHTIESRKKRSKTVSIISKENFKSPEYKKKHLEAVREFTKSKEFKRKRSKIMNNLYKNSLERKKQGERVSKKWFITSPTGESFVIKNLKKFCKENFINGFHDGLYRVSKGIQDNYKNWKCEKVEGMI